ncbi:solute carrier family 25 member 35 [Halyomorpha halys]|uniref:solute carrier family 25 member 35 n=1 Tax=Halyomorpha halys TaxID=286706 RepID=UPI0006D52689|nr:solute carrier family 25 member 35-like [Halyomorpha halys]XP_024216194.1 solute carrier family 25 member 35-like [Halyomorpha halys]XP_024216195.1 solute carrier family 25 member 35-like [Halyomorpha halys]
MEFGLGALAAVGATFFTNPIEVLKTRFQLQGELQQRGQYGVHYRNILHAGYVIVKTEGLHGLQKGLVPSLGHQILMNGVRLGGFNYLAEEKKLNLRSNGEISFLRTAAIGAVTGVVSAYTGSPFYLVKVRMQAQTTEAIAVGTQHKVGGTADALRQIWRNEGITGLWRGSNGSAPRLAVASAFQLSTFSLSKEYIAKNKYYPIEYGLLNSFLASFLGGLVIAVTMNPFDVISTRLYNQGVDAHGRGLIYSSYFDCVSKMWKTERFSGYYKGIVPGFLRIGPHTMLSLIFWDKLKDLRRKYFSKDSQY